MARQIVKELNKCLGIMFYHNISLGWIGVVCHNFRLIGRKIVDGDLNTQTNNFFLADI